MLHVKYGGQGVLLEGDAQREAEEEMLQREPGELQNQVLKVGHHGSETSSTQRFLANVRPRVAIISVGAGNRHGHPAAQTIQALHAVGAQVYRTDLNGTVEVIADKDRMWVRAER